MSASTDNLVVNLSQIYQIKNQIKEVISTDSDVFADYPSYIQAAIQGGGSVSGYAYVTSNGDYDIASYAMVNVEVPIPSGYTYVSGTFNITDNDTYDVSSYAYVDVNVEGGGSGEGTYFYIQEIDNTIPAGIFNEFFYIPDLSQYENLEMRLVRPVNYTDPGSGETHEPYIEWFFTENDAVCSTDNSGSCIDSDGCYFQQLSIEEGSSPDTLVGKYYEWVEDIDPETGDDNGVFEIVATYSAPVTETILDEYPVWIWEYDSAGPNWTIFQEGQFVENLEPEEVVNE